VSPLHTAVARHVGVIPRVAPSDEESRTAFVEIKEYTEKLTQNTMAVFNDMRVVGIA
jgi:hypothetical protein